MSLKGLLHDQIEMNIKEIGSCKHQKLYLEPTCFRHYVSI